MPYQPPWSDIGQVQRDIDQLRRELHDKANDYEVREILRRVDSLEHSLRQIISDVDGVCSRVQILEERLNQSEVS